MMIDEVVLLAPNFHGRVGVSPIDIAVSASGT